MAFLSIIAQPKPFRGWVYTAGTTRWLDTYVEERSVGLVTNVQVAGKRYEFDYVANTSTKRYYAEGKLLATRMTIFGCPPVGT